jgi:hypothetical protein
MLFFQYTERRGEVQMALSKEALEFYEENHDWLWPFVSEEDKLLRTMAGAWKILWRWPWDRNQKQKGARYKVQCWNSLKSNGGMPMVEYLGGAPKVFDAQYDGQEYYEKAKAVGEQFRGIYSLMEDLTGTTLEYLYATGPQAKDEDE